MLDDWDPGPRGDVDLHEPRPVPVLAGPTIARFVFTLVLFFGLVLGSLLWPAEPSLVFTAQVSVGALAYVIVGTILRPKPRTDNMGMAGGLIDNPFQYSDDINRSLFGLSLLLLPGQFLGNSVIDMYNWLARG